MLGPLPNGVKAIRFDTEHGPCFINLEEVAYVSHGIDGHLGKPAIMFKNGHQLRLNETAKHDLTMAMDSWMAGKNAASLGIPMKPAASEGGEG